MDSHGKLPTIHIMKDTNEKSERKEIKSLTYTQQKHPKLIELVNELATVQNTKYPQTALEMLLITILPSIIAKKRVESSINYPI
ncbi:MAG: hypothetical protein PHY02_09600 [Phycisphaerae bacterium]|nr:hypothetical protein [Phycisphaerae bacterium]